MNGDSCDSCASARRELRQLFSAGSLAGLTDAQLVERLAGGSGEAAEAALSALLDRHGPMVWATCSRILGDHHAAEDAFQAVFLVLVRRAGVLAVRQSLGPWLHAVARRVALKTRTSASRRRVRESRVSVSERVEDPATPVDDVVLAVHEEVTRLPAKYRDPIVLCYLEGRTHDETAATLGWPVGTVRGRLARARDLLRARLARRGLGPDGSSPIAILAPLRMQAPPESVCAMTIEIALRGALPAAGVAALVRFTLGTASLHSLSVAATIMFAGVLAAGTALLAGSTNSADSSDETAQVDEGTAAARKADPPAQAVSSALAAVIPEGVVVDRKGQPVANASVFLSTWGRRSNYASIPHLERATTDEAGRFRMNAPAKSAFRYQMTAFLWAYKPGLMLGTGEYHPEPPAQAVRIVLNPEQPHTLTLKRRDGSPARGVRVAPRFLFDYARRGTRAGEMPDAFAELLACESDAQGRVVLSSVPANWLPSPVSVWTGTDSVQVVTPEVGPGRGEPLDTFIVEAAGALAGRVAREDGASLNGLEVQVEFARGTGNSNYGAPVHLRNGGLRLDAAGRYLTPPVLLAGRKYRVVVHGRGVDPVGSAWTDPPGAGKTATLADLVVKPLHEIRGQVVDRQGMPIGGAEVIQSGDGPERTTATTNAAGRFRLGGYRHTERLLFARAEGFRFGGRVIEAGENRVVLTRVSEIPERPMPRLIPALPAAQLRALARRVLDPYLHEALATKDADRAVFEALMVLSMIDANAAQELFAVARRATVDSTLRLALALGLRMTDPEAAVGFAETRAEPGECADALLRIADALPDGQRAFRVSVIEKAAVHGRACAQPAARVWYLGDTAERLLDDGERKNAERLFEEARALAKTLPDSAYRRQFAARLARVDLDSALGMIDGVRVAEERSLTYANFALHLAGSRPEDCERLLDRAQSEKRRLLDAATIARMTRIDPLRARRLVSERTDAFERGQHRLVLASRLSRTSKTQAEEVYREALADLDASPRVNPGSWDFLMLDLELVEQIDPALVPEFLWRTLSLRDPSDEPEDPALGLVSGARLVTIVAQFDRRLASTLWKPVRQRIDALHGQIPNRSLHQFLVAQLRIDPLAAVEWLDEWSRTVKIELDSQEEPRRVLSELLALWSVGRPGRLLPYVSGPADQLELRDLRR